MSAIYIRLTQILVCFVLKAKHLEADWSLIRTQRIQAGEWYAACTIERWVYLWQSGSALQVTGTELKIETKQP